MRIVIVDDQLSMHLILERMLGKIEGIRIIGKFREAADAFDFLKHHEADLVFLDIQLPGESGIELAQRLRQNNLQMKLVFVTSHKDFALPAFEVYPYDYIVKPVSMERLQATVVRALGETYDGRDEKAEETMEAGGSDYPHLERLTKREMEMLIFAARGLSNKEIAGELVLSEGTVKNHFVHIFSKLGVKNRIQAVTVARECKWIE